MKALTVHQPWATALAVGMKQYETRSRITNHRGEIAIHAGKTFNEEVFEQLSGLAFENHMELPLARRWSGAQPQDFPTGSVLAVGELTDCILMDEDLIASISDQERSLGHWEPGRYAYKIENVRLLPEPVSARGKQGLWEWDDGS